jgi:large subunit ribosomal protein L29
MAKFNSRSRVRDMRDQAEGELRMQIEKLNKEFFDLRFKSSTEALASPARFAQIRRDIARLNTLLRERELRTAAAKS